MLLRATQAARRRIPVAVKRCLLMGVFSVPQHGLLVEIQAQVRRQNLPARRLFEFGARKIPADRLVIGCGVGERLRGQVETQVCTHATIVRLHFRDDARVVVRVDDDADAGMVFGSRPQHRGSADIDIFDRIGQRAVGRRNRLPERIEVDDQQVYRIYIMGRHRCIVDAAATQETPVNLRVQGLDATIHDLGKAGVIRDLGDIDTGVQEQFCGPAGG